ncbi:MAG: hypothetical protein GY801_07575 [bacterium]|nr:hypothetical protein [bacterium]
MQIGLLAFAYVTVLLILGNLGYITAPFIEPFRAISEVAGFVKTIKLDHLTQRHTENV